MVTPVSDRLLDSADADAGDTVGPPFRAAPLWPFRLAALAGSFVRSAGQLADGDWELAVLLAAAVVFTLASWRQPVPYRDERGVRVSIVVELTVVVTGILLSGGWHSPLLLFLIPGGMLAGFALGALPSALLSAIAIAAVSIHDYVVVSLPSPARDAAMWAAILGSVAFTSGLAHRAAHDAERHQRIAVERVGQLADANTRLASLEDAGSAIPMSLDLDEVLDLLLSRVRAMFRHDTAAVVLIDHDEATVVRWHGEVERHRGSVDDVAPALRAALAADTAVRLNDLAAGRGLGTTSRSGMYAVMRLRDVPVGVLAVEFDGTGGYRSFHADVLDSLAGPFAIAIDNARLFEGIRRLAADEERTRIARELHDRIGSSLAVIGFELDRAIASIPADEAVASELRELRTQVSATVTEVRNTLFDLRTHTTARNDFAATATAFLEQVALRSGIRTTHDIRLESRLPLGLERELWQIVREAVVNAERHAAATTIDLSVDDDGRAVRVRVGDDGVGFDPEEAHPDRYGLVGMRERAERIAATLAVRPRSGGGTEVLVAIERDTSGAEADEVVHRVGALSFEPMPLTDGVPAPEAAT